MPRRARLQVLPLRVIATLIGYAYELRIDPITTATARNAATFRVTS